MTTLQTTTSEVINLLQPEKVLVDSSNYLQCVIEGNFREFQICYKDKCWYEIKTTGNSYEPVEKLLNPL